MTAFSDMPNLVSAPPIGGGGGDLFGGAPTSLPPTLISPQPAASMPKPAATVAAKQPSGAATADVIPKAWGNVGNLNIDLDNLSLSGRPEKKAGVPMAAMAAKSPSSSESPVSPMGGGFGALAARPPPPSSNNLL